jgi:hypothetical protein
VINRESYYSYENCLRFSRVHIHVYVRRKNRDIQALAEQAESRIIPAKSKDAYIKEYEKFVKWMELKKAKNVDETLMLAYMMEMVS